VVCGKKSLPISHVFFLPPHYKGRKKGVCGVTYAKNYSIFNIGQKRGDEQQRSFMIEPILLNQVKTI